MRTEFLCMSVLRVASPPLLVYSTDRSKVVVPVLVLLFVALCFFFNEAICFKFCLVLFCSCVFQSFEHCDYLA